MSRPANDARSARYRELLKLNRLVASTREYDKVLSVIVEQAARLIGGGAALLLLSDEEGRLRAVAEHHLPAERTARLALDITPGMMTELRDLGREQGLSGFVGVPLVLRGEIIGVLAVYRRVARGASADDEELLSALADQAAIAIDNARLVDGLRNQHRWLQTVIERSPTGIVLAEEGARRIVANRRAVELFGHELDPDAGVGQLVGRIYGADGRALSLDELPFMRALRGEPIAPVELVLHRPDGREIPVVSSAGPIEDASGHVIGAAVVFEDISLLKAIERLREEWTSVIAHDLRQPVNTIALYADRMVRKGDAVPAIQDMARHIRISADRLNRMICDLLDFSRIESNALMLHKERADLDVLLPAVLERAAAETGGHPLRLDAEEDLPEVEVDPGRFEQIVDNLLSNAAKYSYPDSEIQVIVRRVRGEVRISVANQGEGIPPEELSRLFGRFQRLSSARRGGAAGFGLGLYITRGLVESHGGRIWAESVPGLTTSFHFTLPVAQVARGRVGDQTPSSPAPG